jgi:hypothetical protein
MRGFGFGGLARGFDRWPQRKPAPNAHCQADDSKKQG